jgi:diguanylate cyclase (GGDEF)-like protein
MLRRNFVLVSSVASGLATLITLSLFDVVTRTKDLARETERLNSNVYRAAEIIQNRTNQIAETLRTTGVVVTQAVRTGQSTAAAFDTFIVETAIFDGHPELSALAVLRVIPEAGLEAAVKDANADRYRFDLGYPPLILNGAVADGPLVLVDLMYPKDMADLSTGLNLMTTGRRDTLKRVISSGSTLVSQEIPLLDGRVGVIFYQPLYRAEGDRLPYAMAAAALSTSVLLTDLRSQIEPLDVNLDMHDLGPIDQLSDPGTETLMGRPADAETEGGGTSTGRRSVSDAQSGPARSQSRVFRDVEVGGRLWRVFAEVREAPPSLWFPQRNNVLGLAVAILVTLLMYRGQRASSLLTRVVAERTSALSEAVDALETERRAAEALARVDDLTGLLNRRGFHETASPVPDDSALLHLDLDGFKDINDTMGHPIGDRVLVEVAQRLVQLAPRDAIVARMGGDEFAVLLPAGDASEMARAMIAWAATPFDVGPRQARFGVSIGMTTAAESGAEIDAMLVDADIALYAAKEAGKSCLRRFDRPLRYRQAARREVADDLRRALDRGEFTPFFQPKFGARTKCLSGFEALVRWRHPDRGIHLPGEFLGVARSSGLLREIDQAVMRATVDQIRDIEAAGHDVHEVSVNLSLERLRDPSLIESLDALPEMSATLTFEIVESVFLDDAEDALTWQLDALRERDVRLSVDDFGTGHASVVALTRLAPDELKIDRELIRPIVDDPRQCALVRSIIEMGKALGISTLAEGVETMAHADILADLGASSLQGFALGKPMPSEKALSLCARQEAMSGIYKAG